MHTEYLIVDEGGHRQTVKAVGEGLPEFDVVAASVLILGVLAFVVETVDAVDGRAFVVAA
jgi:hypothetical protein